MLVSEALPTCAAELNTSITPHTVPSNPMNGAPLTAKWVEECVVRTLCGGECASFRLRGYAAPERDAVFFAGEATHVGVNPCMQGAMETGTRAADEVLKSLGRG